jgi:hypothetical protein
MLATGDLVKIKSGYLKYFAGKLALINRVASVDEYKKGGGKILCRRRYLVILADNLARHFFSEEYLEIISKVDN